MCEWEREEKEGKKSFAVKRTWSEWTIENCEAKKKTIIKCQARM